jgi:hypothetical protein
MHRTMQRLVKPIIIMQRFEGGGQAHRSLKQRGSPPLESRGSKHPLQTRRPQPLRPPSRRAAPRAVAAPSPAFSLRKVSQFAIHSTWVLHRRPDSCWGAPWLDWRRVRLCGRVVVVARARGARTVTTVGGYVTRRPTRIYYGCTYICGVPLVQQVEQEHAAQRDDLP